MMTALMQCYLNSKSQYLHAQKVLATRFDLQWVSDLLTDSVRRAGFTPCLGIDNLHAIDRRKGLQTVTSVQIENKPRQFIQINRMNEWFVPIVRIINPTQILVPRTVEFNEKRPLLIADCEHAEIHQLASIESLPRNYRITLTKPMLFSYEPVVYCGEWLEEQWLIKKNARGKDALYYHGAQTEELTTHIHSLVVNSQWIHGKRLFEISLNLDEDKKQQLVVAVRGS
jgi:hypothetical protein